MAIENSIVPNLDEVPERIDAFVEEITPTLPEMDKGTLTYP
jgi:hypothetical protein